MLEVILADALKNQGSLQGDAFEAWGRCLQEGQEDCVKIFL